MYCQALTARWGASGALGVLLGSVVGLRVALLHPSAHLAPESPLAVAGMAGMLAGLAVVCSAMAGLIWMCDTAFLAVLHTSVARVCLQWEFPGPTQGLEDQHMLPSWWVGALGGADTQIGASSLSLSSACPGALLSSVSALLHLHTVQHMTLVAVCLLW
jgi:hypothetical protein